MRFTQVCKGLVLAGVVFGVVGLFGVACDIFDRGKCSERSSECFSLVSLLCYVPPGQSNENQALGQCSALIQGCVAQSAQCED